MFDLLLSLNIKQHKKIGESGLVSYGSDWKVQAPTKCVFGHGYGPNLVTRPLLTFVSNIDNTEQ